MKKLAILVMAMVMVFGLSLGVIAEDLASDTITVNATIEDYASINIVESDLSFSFVDGNDTETLTSDVELAFNDNFNLAVSYDETSAHSDITITTEINESTWGPGDTTLTDFLSVTAVYDGYTESIGDGDVASGTVTITVSQ